MKDQIIESYLKDFVDEFQLGALDEPEQFEAFVNYCVIAKHYTEQFDPQEIGVGGSGDLGMDGVGILVNDHLVWEEKEVDYFKKALRRLDASFVFIQTKTSTSFDGGDIGTFISGVRSFFGRGLPVGANGDIQSLHSVKEYIYKSSVHMDKSPTCLLYYATTGSWTDDPNLLARIAQGKSDLMQSGLFSTVDFIPLDSERIKRAYLDLKHKVVREITFEKHTILPRIKEVAEAYIGILPALEYLKLLLDDDGNLNRRIFYDNVRDFQGNNSVNSEIQASLVNEGESDRFTLLNNGITIVSRDVTKIGTSFRLKEYQIVNGCQTSHVIYQNRSHLTDQVYVPIKLIVTDNIEVTNQIIEGTNSQTEVKREAFESLAPFQKNLEEMYAAVARKRSLQLYYERRSKQYDYLDIKKDYIITMPTQIKCFVAMFLNEPHSTHRYYGELLSSYRNRVFNDSHHTLPYVAAGAAFAKAERLFNDGLLPKEGRSFKSQLLMVVRIQNELKEMPTIDGKRIAEYCENILDILSDEDRSVKVFSEANRLIGEVRQKMAPWQEQPERTRAFTTALIEAASGGNRQLRRSRIWSSPCQGLWNRLGRLRNPGSDRSCGIRPLSAIHHAELRSRRGYHVRADIRYGNGLGIDHHPGKRRTEILNARSPNHKTKGERT